MSSAILLGLLAAHTGAPVEPWTPPESPVGPPPGEAVGGLPVLDDKLAMSLRPDGRSIATLTVGSGRDYLTIRDALDRAAAMQRAKAGAEGGMWPSVTDLDATARMRDYRVDVIIDPGFYPEGETEPLTLPPHVALYAADGQHSSVHVGVGVNTEGWTHCEGLHVKPPTDGTVGGKYASHHTNRGTTVWSRSTLDTEGRAGGGGGDVPIGMDGVPMGHLCLYDTALTGSWANLHGWEGMLEPEEVCLVNVAYPTGRVQYAALNDSAASQVWVVDSNLSALTINGAAVQSHVSGTTIAGGFTPTDTRSDWPVPVGGISPTWRARLA